MDKEIEDICEYILKDIANKNDGEYYELYSYFKLENGEPLSQHRINPKRIVSELEKYDFSKPLYNERCELTELGVEIGKGIGFKAYVKELKKQNFEKIKKDTERIEKQDKKLDIDIYLGEFEKKIGTKFKTWGFIITVINIIIAIGGIIISNQDSEQSYNQKTDQELHIEKKLNNI